MKVAISATGDNIKADVDKRFGRCAWFLFVDTESMQCEAIGNKNADAASGAGSGCAQLVLGKEVDAVISGRVGPNAYEVLKQGGVKIFIASQEMSAGEAIDKLNNNELKQMEMKVF
ncbi:MAG TPA: dinitrogenase iron-molybdenum cofactor biosynthesis protein [Candidatus Marinimicrobia bacterium]|nr:dinitrogenase iron-molybdenum cofactor biosynthesis protein [Candidatus Neomarinimicrobiota bacterium]